ncbi:sel1 repeat family protein [Akkermansiaceae bacterium]|nr:sel1 repeat family protein [Akkermansiaceae bacterium]
MKSVFSVLLLCFLLASCGEEKTIQGRAEAGDVDAQNNLGEMYYKGLEAPRNLVKAAKWYRKSADSGNAHGQFKLGVMYYQGLGVPEDEVEAVKWFRKSAEQGDADGQAGLGMMYAIGAGVPQDDVKAYMFYNLVAAKGFEDFKARRNEIEKRMTQEQIAEGEKLTREWVARKAKEKGE